MSSNGLRPTFRDPAGSLSLTDDFAVRTIHPGSRAAVLSFLDSAFYRDAVARGEMSATTIENPDAAGPDAPLVLKHPRIAIPTYPWEWTPSQWLAAAELTLALGERALESGWILKDATPLNILFDGPNPVLVDVLSFDPRDPSDATWLAYGQYMRTFLLPLLAQRLLGWPLELTQLRRDGYEASDLYAMLSWKQRLSPAALWPISMPFWLERKGQDDAAKGKATARRMDPQAAAHVIAKLMQSLAKRTRAAIGAGGRSEWSEYTGTLTHYTAAEAEAKRTWVEQQLATLKPGRVLDIGANTGDFSALAATQGAQVISLERDATAADQIYKRSLVQKLDVQTIHADLSRPTPAVGWENQESLALLSRLEQQFHMVMMLAVIHHIVLLEQIPLRAIVELAARLTRRWLIVEWVPVEDPMFQSLMRGRTELYGHLHERDLLAACEGLFRVAAEHRLTNGRVLFLLEKMQ